MRARSSLKFAPSIAVAAIWLSACASGSEHGPTILAGMGADGSGAQAGIRDRESQALEPEGPIPLPYRGPGSGGIAYRLTYEAEGERAFRKSSGSDRQGSIRNLSTLEAEFRELPVEGADSSEGAFLLGLDGLLYTEKQQNPPLDRETEIADDRLRIKVNGEASVDNRGNRGIGPLGPRLFLNRIFGVISHDASGNPIALSSRGAPAARRLMNGIPLLASIAYAMVSLPQEPIAPGATWTGSRIPPSRAGELGLSLSIGYSLAGFERFEGVPCAMILLDARIDDVGITGVTGHAFDRAQATLDGTAWVELRNSLVRRVSLSDQIRVSWSDRDDIGVTTEHWIEHASKLVLALRDPDERTRKWSDGTPRFDSH